MFQMSSFIRQLHVNDKSSGVNGSWEHAHVIFLMIMPYMSYVPLKQRDA